MFVPPSFINIFTTENRLRFICAFTALHSNTSFVINPTQFRLVLLQLLYNLYALSVLFLAHTHTHTQYHVILHYCITPIFRVEEIFAIFANLDFARNFPPAKIISTANGISRNFPRAKFSSREIFLPTKINL